jgi:hypothetical protein
MQLSELEPEVALEVPGAPRFAVIDALVAAAREFFVDSRAWRVPFGPVEMASQIRPSLPGDTFLVEAVRVEVDGERLNSGLYGTGEDDTVVLVDGVRGQWVRGTVAVAPTRDAFEIPERLGQEVRDGLVRGALARLMRIPKAEWSDPQLAMLYQIQFEEAKDRAATRAENGFVKNRTRTVRYGGY